MADAERSDDAGLARLIALEEIRTLKADYFLHTDLQNWDALERLFVPGAETDFRDSVGGPPDESLLMHDPKAFVSNNARVLAGIKTAHFGYMPRFTFREDGDIEAIWSMEDWLWIPDGAALPPGTMHGFGHYHDRYTRHEGRWKFATTRLTRIRVDFL